MLGDAPPGGKEGRRKKTRRRPQVDVRAGTKEGPNSKGGGDLKMTNKGGPAEPLEKKAIIRYQAPGGKQLRLKEKGNAEVNEGWGSPLTTWDVTCPRVRGEHEDGVEETLSKQGGKRCNGDWLAEGLGASNGQRRKSQPVRYTGGRQNPTSLIRQD